MINPQLVNYIKSVKFRGYTSEQIYSNLVKQGYNTADVMEAIKFVDTPLKQNPPEKKSFFKKHKSLAITLIALFCLSQIIIIPLLFTKGMFTKFPEGSDLSPPPPNVPATASEPIVLGGDGENIDINAAKDYVFLVSFFNNGFTSQFNPTIKCGVGEMNADLSLLTENGGLIAVWQRVDTQTYKNFKIIIKSDTFNCPKSGCTGKEQLPLGENVCNIEFYDINTNTLAESKRIIINAK